MSIKKNFFAPLASGLGATRRAAALLLVMLLTATTAAWATDKTLSGSESYTAQDGDVLTGSTSGTVTIANNAKITLSDVTITGGIVCEGTAEITIAGTNSVTGFSRFDPNIDAYRRTAGIQIGGSGTTLTINGDGSLTANGAQYAAGIGLNGAWNVTEDVIGGNIVINGGNITANGGVGAAGIGAGFTKDQNNSSERKAIVGNITIKGGTVTAVGVTAVGGNGADGIGAGDNIYNATYQIGTVTIYDDIDKVDASSIKDFASVVYMHGESDVTASKSDYFTITEDGDRRVIVPKDNTDYTITIADGIEHGTLEGAVTAKYMERVTITATPALGYRFSRLVVRDAQNNAVESTGNSFFMPKSNVTVSAVFEQGTHGTTEFAWGYNGNHNQGFVKEATIYDGLTTVNIQETGQNVYTGTSYHIRKYEGDTYYNFRLDNNENEQAIPFTGTGEFVYNYNPTAFYVTDNNELGFYDITMTDVGNGKWSVSILKTVAVMDAVPDQTYTGSAITPEPLVLAGSLSLTKGTDYTYSYENNTDAGTATVRATFQGDYESLGSVEKEFTILPSTVVVNVTGNGTVTYNDKVATNGEVIGVTAEKGTDVTLTLAPTDGYAARSVEYGYTFLNEYNNEVTASGFKLPISGTTATLTVPNNMKDGTYVNLTVTFVSALAGGADEALAVALTDNTVTNFAGGWYKVDSDITFDHTLNLLGDTHLIIDNGKTMTVNTASNHGIDSEYTLNVSGEGALNITTTEAYKIAVRVGSYVQTGATVTANGYIGIRCKDNFDEFNVTNDFTFSGGQLTATGSGGNGIWADNDITLSCTNATDFIQASSYSSAFGAVKIAEGKMLVDATDGSKYYIGDGNALSSSAISAIAGKTLKPGLLLIDNADNSAQINALGGLQTTAILQGRKLWKDGDWNTLCLPFDVTIAGSPLAGDHVVAKVLNTSSELAGGVLTLNFDNAPATITAGTPFIIKWDNTGVNLINPVFEGVTTSNTTNNVAFTGGTFKGNYGPLEITDANRNDILLLAAGNKLGYAKTDRTIANGKAMGSCRAYFEIPSNGGGQAQARSFVLNFGNDNTTGIIEVNTNLTDITNKAEGIYDLQGRKVENPKKGLYIVNGRKVLVK